MSIFSYLGRYYISQENVERLEDRTQRLFEENFPDNTIIPPETHPINFLFLATDDSSENILCVSHDDIEAAGITMLQHFCSYVKPNSSSEDVMIIPLKLNGRCLHHLEDYINIVHSAGPMEEIKKPLRTNDLTQIVEPVEYATWVHSLTQEDVFEITLTSNLLDIKPLLDLTCASVAAKIKGKTPEEIRRTFNLDDFTPTEENRSRKKIVG